MFILIAAMVGVMYFALIRPQKKKQKEEQATRDNIQLGDEITTIGGIIGKVVTIKEDTITIETGVGSDSSKIKLTRWSISSNNTATAKVEAERKAAKEAEEAEKAARIEENAGKSKKKKSKKNKDSLED
jgi:preprotein translocase subunit YajC